MEKPPRNHASYEKAFGAFLKDIEPLVLDPSLSENTRKEIEGMRGELISLSSSQDSRKFLGVLQRAHELSIEHRMSSKQSQSKQNATGTVEAAAQASAQEELPELVRGEVGDPQPEARGRKEVSPKAKRRSGVTKEQVAKNPSAGLRGPEGDWKPGPISGLYEQTRKELAALEKRLPAKTRKNRRNALDSLHSALENLSREGNREQYLGVWAAMQEMRKEIAPKEAPKEARRKGPKRVEAAEPQPRALSSAVPLQEPNEAVYEPSAFEPANDHELPEMRLDESGAWDDAEKEERSEIYEKPWPVSLDAENYSASADLTREESRNRLKRLIARITPSINQTPKEETDSERASRLAARFGVSPALAAREFNRSSSVREMGPKEPGPVEDLQAIEKDTRTEPHIEDDTFASIEDRPDPKFSERTSGEHKVDFGPLPETFPDTKVNWSEAESAEAGALRAELHGGSVSEALPPPSVAEGAVQSGAGFGRLGEALETGAAAARKEAWAVKLAEKAGLGKDREAMLGAERIRLDAEYDFYAKHSLLGRWHERQVGADEGGAVKRSDRAYAEKALAFEQKLEERLRGHLTKRQEGMTSEEAEDFEKRFSAKYRRMVVSRDVIDHGEERLAAMRDRALDEKEKTVFEKGIALYSRQNSALEQKLGKKTARAVRILGLSVAGAGLAAPFGAAFGVSTIGIRMARSIVGTFMGSAAGHVSGSGYQKFFGARAERSLKEAREDAASTSEEFARKRAAYRKGNERSVEKKRRIVEALSAVFVGAGASVETAHWLAGHEAVQKAAENVNASSKLLSHHGLAPEHIRATNIPRMSVESDIHATPPSLFEAPVVHAAHGFGYEHMLKGLRANLIAEGHTASDFPPDSDAHALLSANDAHLDGELHRLASDPTHHFFRTVDGRSTVVRAGATLTIDSHGTALYSADGKISSVAVAPEHAATASAHHATSPQNATEQQVTAKLNQDELLQVQKGNAANLAWHEAHPGGVGATDASVGTLHETAPAALSASAETAPSATHALEQGPAFENAHGVSIEPAHVHAYWHEYRGRPTLFVSGGGTSEADFQSRLDYIQDTLAQDPKLHGAHIFLDATQFNSDGTSDPAVGEFLIDDEGKLELVQPTAVENILTGKKVPLPSPDSFTDRYVPPKVT